MPRCCSTSTGCRRRPWCAARVIRAATRAGRWSGIFAQRGKDRPNRLGSTVVEILGREGRSLLVRGLDAIDGTPVLDIKPVMAEFLPRSALRQPAWSHELMREYWAVAKPSTYPRAGVAQYPNPDGYPPLPLAGEGGAKRRERAVPRSARPLPNPSGKWERGIRVRRRSGVRRPWRPAGERGKVGQGERTNMNLAHWPQGLSRSTQLPQTSLYFNLEVSATRYPDKAAIHFYGSTIRYARLKREVDALAGFLQQDCGVVRGDRIALYMQNSPQFIIAFYAILRADAVVVLVNPMNLAEELRHFVSDSGAKIAIAGQELLANVQPLLGGTAAAGYRCRLFRLPDRAHRPGAAGGGGRLRRLPLSGAALARERGDRAAAGEPLLHRAGPGRDPSVIPYTSGTTGAPKGCMHTHASVMHTIVAPAEYGRYPKDGVAPGRAADAFHASPACSTASTCRSTSAPAW